MDTSEHGQGRRTMIAGLGAAAAGFAVGATTACAQTGEAPVSGFQPARHEPDAWLDAAPGVHRVFIDSASAVGGANAVLYANNLYNAQESAYAGSPSDFAMVVCFRHFSTPFGYTDAVWEKYGEFFHGVMQMTDPETGEAPAINLMMSDRAGLPNGGNTVQSVVERGTQFAICEAATRYFSGQIATAVGGDADEIFAELTSNAIPASRFVSAGVIAMTRAQEYGYSLLSAG